MQRFICMINRCKTAPSIKNFAYLKIIFNFVKYNYKQYTL